MVLLFIVLLNACKKENTVMPPGNYFHPKMEYTELGGKEITFNKSQHIDLENDGKRDFSFVTVFIGDPIFKRDIIQFSATSTADRMLLVDNNDDSPIFNKGDFISGNNTPGYNWHEVVITPLAQKFIEDQKPVYWIGAWKNVIHKYLAFQVMKNGQYFNGWFEISMDTSLEKLIIHRAAVCKEHKADVKAGY